MTKSYFSFYFLPPIPTCGNPSPFTQRPVFSSTERQRPKSGLQAARGHGKIVAHTLLTVRLDFPVGWLALSILSEGLVLGLLARRAISGRRLWLMNDMANGVSYVLWVRRLIRGSGPLLRPFRFLPQRHEGTKRSTEKKTLFVTEV